MKWVRRSCLALGVVAGILIARSYLPGNESPIFLLVLLVALVLTPSMSIHSDAKVSLPLTTPFLTATALLSTALLVDAYRTGDGTVRVPIAYLAGKPDYPSTGATGQWCAELAGILHLVSWPFIVAGYVVVVVVGRRNAHAIHSAERLTVFPVKPPSPGPDSIVRREARSQPELELTLEGKRRRRARRAQASD